jgi:hypothetical protein
MTATAKVKQVEDVRGQLQRLRCRADADGLDVELREIGPKAGVHVMVNVRDGGPRVLDYWPSNGTVMIDATKGKAESCWHALEMAACIRQGFSPAEALEFPAPTVVDAEGDGKAAPKPADLPPEQPLESVADGGEAPAKDRDQVGRFAPGNRIGRGNPHARRLAALRTAMFEVVDADKLRALAERMYVAAVGGDWAAAQLLLSYCLGRPYKAPDPDRLDLDEWQLLTAAPTRLELLRSILSDVDTRTAIETILAEREACPSRPTEVLTAAADDFRGKGLGAVDDLRAEEQAKRRRMR